MSFLHFQTHLLIMHCQLGTYNDYIDYFVLQRTKWLLRPAKFCIMFHNRWIIFWLATSQLVSNINEMYNMMILQKLVEKQGRVAVTSITNILISSLHMMRIVGWKNMLSGHFFVCFGSFSPIFHYSGSCTYSNLTRVWKSSKSIFSHLVLYVKGASGKVPDLRVFYWLRFRDILVLFFVKCSLLVWKKNRLILENNNWRLVS